MAKGRENIEITWRGKRYPTFTAAYKAIAKDVEDFDRKQGTKAKRKAARETVREVVLPEARARVPYDTGDLEASLKVRAMRRSRGRVGSGLFGGSKQAFEGLPFYALFQEFGWFPRGTLRDFSVAPGEAKRPHAQPFLRPALFGQQSQILQTSMRKFQKELFR